LLWHLQPAGSYHRFRQIGKIGFPEAAYRNLTQIKEHEFLNGYSPVERLEMFASFARQKRQGYGGKGISKDRLHERRRLSSSRVGTIFRSGNEKLVIGR